MLISLAERYLLSVILLALTGCANINAPQPAIQAAASQAAASTGVELENKLKSFQFSAHLTNKLLLSGHLPDEAAQSSLMNLAASIFPGTEIVDEMRADGVTVSGWHRTTRWGLSSLSKLEEGKLIINDHTLHLEGRAANATIKVGIEAATIGLKEEIEHMVDVIVAE